MHSTGYITDHVTTNKRDVAQEGAQRPNDCKHVCLLVLQDAQIGFLVVLLILIAAGNAIVLTAISLSRERRRSRMNFFIMHLAVCGKMLRATSASA